MNSILVTLRRVRVRSVLRLGWGIADQGVSSITNFAVVVAVAHSLDAAQFGSFGLAYLTYGFVLSLSRGISSYPLQARFSNTDLPAWRQAVTNSCGTAIVTGVVSGLVVLAVAGLLGGGTGAGLAALGLTLPGLLLQDSWRYAFFVLGRGSRAFVNDTVWAVAQFPGIFVLRVAHTRNVFWFVLVWGGAALVAAAIGPIQARVIPRPHGAMVWLSETRDLGIRYAISNIVTSGSEQVRSSIVAGLLGLASVGYIQAAGTIMGPFMVIFYGIGLVTVPEAARRLCRAPQGMLNLCILVSVGLAATALAWGLLLFLALPHGLGRLVLGAVWRPSYPLILPVTIATVGNAIAAGADTGLGAMGAAQRSMRASMIGSVALLICSVIGPLSGGTTGTVLIGAVAAWFGAFLLWWELSQTVRQYDLNAEGRRTRIGRPGGRHRRQTLPRVYAQASPARHCESDDGHEKLPGDSQMAKTFP